MRARVRLSRIQTNVKHENAWWPYCLLPSRASRSSKGIELKICLTLSELIPWEVWSIPIETFRWNMPQNPHSKLYSLCESRKITSCLEQKPGWNEGMTLVLQPTLPKPLIISYQDITQPKGNYQIPADYSSNVQAQSVRFWGPAPIHIPMRLLTWLSWLQNARHDIFTRFRLSFSIGTTCFGCLESVHLTKMHKGFFWG